MVIPGWKAVLLLFAVVVLILNEVLWQWLWWRLDHIAGTNDTCSPGNYKLIGNDSTIMKCQPCHPCGTGMKLTPPCGRTVTLDTIVMCVPIEIHATKRIPRKTHLPTEGIKLTNLSNSLPYTVKRWERKRRPKLLIQQSKRPKHFTTSYTEELHGKTSNATWGSQIINITYVLSGFPWVECVAVVVLVIISILLGFVVWRLNSVRHIIWNKDCRDYQRLKSAESIEEMSYSSDDAGHLNVKNSTDLSTSPDDLKGLILSELPPDLEVLLVEKLDVRRKGEHRYGWQKVGAAFEICRDELRHLKIEYKRENGSPTSKLLLKLGTSKCATISDLINVLKSHKVNRPDVASRVIQFIQAVSNSQHA